MFHGLFDSDEDIPRVNGDTRPAFMEAADVVAGPKEWVESGIWG